MKLTWTFYPKHNDGQSISLTVIYVPALDAEKLPGGGFLTADNIAYVDWPTYKLFDTVDLQARQHAFRQLVAIQESGGVHRSDGSVILLPRP